MTFTQPPAPIVVDASVAVDVALGRSPAITAWQQWATEGRMLLAPPLAWTEIANALVKRDRASATQAGRTLELLAAAGLETADRGWRGAAYALELVARHGLSAYDAAYLWLAIDVDGELATVDRALATAATAEGVSLAGGLEPAT